MPVKPGFNGPPFVVNVFYIQAAIFSSGYLRWQHWQPAFVLASLYATADVAINNLTDKSEPERVISFNPKCSNIKIINKVKYSIEVSFTHLIRLSRRMLSSMLNPLCRKSQRWSAVSQWLKRDIAWRVTRSFRAGNIASPTTANITIAAIFSDDESITSFARSGVRPWFLVLRFQTTKPWSRIKPNTIIPWAGKRLFSVNGTVDLAISPPQRLRLLNPIKSKAIAQSIRASPIMLVCTLGSPSFLLCLKLSINVTSERAIIMANTGRQPIQVPNRLPIKNAATPAPHREYMIMPVAMSVGGMLTLLRKRILYS